MAGMWIAHIDVKDNDRYAEYVKGSGEIFSSYDGVIIARGGKYRQMEGKEYTRNVVIRFPTYDRAVECYESEEYQALVTTAKENSERTLVIVEVDD
jgi:uncharacterized protein (DUF1330 family)